MRNSVFISAIFILLIQVTSCKKRADFSCTEGETILYSKVNYPLGVAVDPARLQGNEAYEKIVSTQFNAITAENVFKMSYLQPLENEFDWTAADELTDYALMNGQQIHGHTLIWHAQTPGWIHLYEGNEDDWDALLKNHVQTVMEHFKGKVSSWDVVNEAFEEDGSLRQTIWLEHLGEAYIEKAFIYAHEADPEALLFYNDYNLLMGGDKLEAVLNFMSKLKVKGVPIDGIGSQSHISINFPRKKKIEKTLDDIVAENFMVRISELDVSVNPDGKKLSEPTPKNLRCQGKKYLEVFEAFNQIPKEYQHGLTIWGVSDADSWIPGFFGRDDYPLLYDRNYQPKPGYCYLINRL